MSIYFPQLWNLKPFFAAQSHFGQFWECKVIFQSLLKAILKPFFEKILLIFLEFLNQIFFFPLLIKSDIDFKINIWKTFVSPHLEMGAIPYIYSNKKPPKQKLTNSSSNP